MTDRIGHVKNPLTIIAIFAAIAEVNATVVISLIDENYQYIFVWFIMLFPALLVVLFFITLYFNHHVLYAPSDFKDEQNYFKGFKKATFIERTEKVIREIEESSVPVNTLETAKDNAEIKINKPTVEVPEPLVPNVNIRSEYALIEKLALQRLSKETSKNYASEISAVFGSRKYVFDAVATGTDNFDFVEISFVKSASGLFNRITKDLTRFKEIYNDAPANVKSKFSLTIIFVTPLVLSEDELDTWLSRAAGHVNNIPFTLDIKIYDLPSLKRDVK